MNNRDTVPDSQILAGPPPDALGDARGDWAQNNWAELEMLEARLRNGADAVKDARAGDDVDSATRDNLKDLLQGDYWPECLDTYPERDE